MKPDTIDADSPIRVLLANDRLGYGDARFHGGGRLIVDWSRALLERGVDLVPVILRRPGELGKVTRSLKLPFVFLGRGLYDPRTYFDFRRLIRWRSIQVLHLQAFGASFFGRLAALRANVPAIVHIHADYRSEPRGYPWFVRLFDRLLASHTQHVLAVSEAAAEFARSYQGFHRARVDVRHNPIDLTRFREPEPDRPTARRALGLPDAAHVAICVARFHPVKGVDSLLEAWSARLDGDGAAYLLLAGDGPQRSALQERARQLRHPDRVRFLGYVEDMATAYRAADVVVMPSRTEGLPLAALEGMACGLPLVAYRVGGIPEIVFDGENGSLVAPADHEALGDALKKLLTDVETRQRYARCALEVAEKHDVRRFAADLESLYRVVARRGRR